MKLPALLIALLAFAGGSAFAQAPSASGNYGNPPAASAEKAPAAEKATPKADKMTMAQKSDKRAEKHASRHHATHHASAKHKGNQHASAAHHKATRHASARHHAAHLASARHQPKHFASAQHATHSMGAGPASPMTDIGASSRQRRMDRAYADWQARRR